MLYRLMTFLRERLRPSLGDVVLAAMVGQLFYFREGWSSLLADGDTGWHIRTGDWILQSRSVPTTDLFSFTRAGESWFAWEWLSDLLMSLVHLHWGLAGVSVAGGCVILLSVMVLFRHMLWRGANVVVAFGVLLLAVGASSIHYLARPHVFTLLLMAVSLWMVERDRRKPGRAVWLLVPLSAVWVNLHGGFFALPVSLAAFAAGLGIEAWLDRPQRAVKWTASRRYAALAGVTSVASILNPYGIKLHLHVARYLASDWIRNRIVEFQSPDFRSESLLRFEVLLFAALLLGGWLLARKQVADAALVLLWGHMALGSVRHVPIFAIVAAPLVAVEVSRLWESFAGRRSPRSAWRIVWSLGAEMAPSFQRFSLWALAVAGAVWLLTPAARWPKDFPESRFPVSLVQKESPRLIGARVFTSDQWGDYLIYRGWPRQKVFIDGRSDFYGPALGDEYLALMNGRRGWENLFRKYDITVALIPLEWPLVSLLDRDPGWRQVREDKLGVLYERSDKLAPPGG
jgi:hypothetical protein